MSTIALNLFQVTPSEQLLSLSAADAIDALYDSGLIEDETMLQKVMLARTVRDLLNCFVTGSKNNNRDMTLAMNQVLASTTLSEGIGWNIAERGIRVSQLTDLAAGEHRSFQSTRYATLKADRLVGDRVFFNVTVRNRGVFSQNLPIADMLADLLRMSGRDIYLPAVDTIRGNKCVITGFQQITLFHNRQGQSDRWGDFLVKRGRLNQEEYARRTDAALNGNKAEAEMVVAWCRHGGTSGKLYAYPARDLALIASEALHGFVDDRRQKQLPTELAEAGDLCALGFKAIRTGMEDKASVFGGLEQAVGTWFDRVQSREAHCYALDYEHSHRIRRREKFSLKVVAPDRAERAALNSRNVILYPTDGGTPDSERIFMGFFTGPTCQARNLGFEFSKLTYSQQIAIELPRTIAERVEESVGPGANVVMAWRRRSNGTLVNNKLVEFELMRRGIAVQHVVDEGQRGNANKVGHLLQGMKEKFALHPNDKCEVESPFDIALGLDVSRFAGLDVPAFPVVVDRDGNATIYMAETIDRSAKEKRGVDELVSTLSQITESQPRKVLFLRDGYALEDFEAVAAALPHVELTVLSIRKNLLGAFSDELPSGDLYAVYADHDSNRFLFGVNARQGEESRINTVHMVEIVRNPGGYLKEQLGHVLIELSRQNRTSELEIASLPFPIAYADRTAWTVRDMMQDRQLRKYVREQFVDEVNQLGDEGLYIYSVIRNYVLTRANGYAFAV
ncbi:hypothetical protein [Cupriavidus sp. M-11]|uniref:hypothetical protein n=1 Tax=Cupriavidus sp. M-11 TaxID=3233038 RepID=UPI003F8EE89B